MSVRFSMLMILGLLAVSGCQQRPLTPQEVQDQHRFEVGCRGSDAQGYEENTPYCGHEGGGGKIP